MKCWRNHDLKIVLMVLAAQMILGMNQPLPRINTLLIYILSAGLNHGNFQVPRAVPSTGRTVQGNVPIEIWRAYWAASNALNRRIHPHYWNQMRFIKRDGSRELLSALQGQDWLDCQVFVRSCLSKDHYDGPGTPERERYCRRTNWFSCAVSSSSVKGLEHAQSHWIRRPKPKQQFSVQLRRVASEFPEKYEVRWQWSLGKQIAEPVAKIQSLVTATATARNPR